MYSLFVKLEINKEMLIKYYIKSFLYVLIWYKMDKVLYKYKYWIILWWYVSNWFIFLLMISFGMLCIMVIEVLIGFFLLLVIFVFL